MTFSCGYSRAMWPRRLPNAPKKVSRRQLADALSTTIGDADPDGAPHAAPKLGAAAAAPIGNSLSAVINPPSPSSRMCDAYCIHSPALYTPVAVPAWNAVPGMAPGPVALVHLYTPSGLLRLTA